jgi:DNA-binding protein H-NS
LEKIPDIDPALTTRIKALPDKVKTKLKGLVDELISGKAPEVLAPEVVATVAAPTTTTTETIQAGLNTLSTSEKEEVIKDIMELLNKSGVLEEIKKQICTPAPPATTPSPTPVGGANKKKRRKTKKNIRRPKKSYTKFGRTF